MAHSVRYPIFDIHLVGDAFVLPQVEQGIKEIIYQALLPVLEQVLDEFDQAEAVWSIPQLVLNLGEIPYAQASHLLPERVAQALREALQSTQLRRQFNQERYANDTQATQHAQLEAVAHYLHTGRSVWWRMEDSAGGGISQRASPSSAKLDIQALIKHIAQQSPALLRIWLHQIGKQPLARQRLLQKFDDHSLAELSLGALTSALWQFETLQANLYALMGRAARLSEAQLRALWWEVYFGIASASLDWASGRTAQPFFERYLRALGLDFAQWWQQHHPHVRVVWDSLAPALRAYIEQAIAQQQTKFIAEISADASLEALFQAPSIHLEQLIARLIECGSIAPLSYAQLRRLGGLWQLPASRQMVFQKFVILFEQLTDSEDKKFQDNRPKTQEIQKSEQAEGVAMPQKDTQTSPKSALQQLQRLLRIFFPSLAPVWLRQIRLLGAKFSEFGQRDVPRFEEMIWQALITQLTQNQVSPNTPTWVAGWAEAVIQAGKFSDKQAKDIRQYLRDTVSSPESLVPNLPLPTNATNFENDWGKLPISTPLPNAWQQVRADEVVFFWQRHSREAIQQLLAYLLGKDFAVYTSLFEYTGAQFSSKISSEALRRLWQYHLLMYAKLYAPEAPRRGLRLDKWLPILLDIVAKAVGSPPQEILRDWQAQLPAAMAESLSRLMQYLNRTEASPATPRPTTSKRHDNSMAALEAKFAEASPLWVDWARVLVAQLVRAGAGEASKIWRLLVDFVRKYPSDTWQKIAFGWHLHQTLEVNDVVFWEEIPTLRQEFRARRQLWTYYLRVIAHLQQHKILPETEWLRQIHQPTDAVALLDIFKELSYLNLVSQSPRDLLKQWTQALQEAKTPKIRRKRLSEAEKKELLQAQLTTAAQAMRVLYAYFETGTWRLPPALRLAEVLQYFADTFPDYFRVFVWLLPVPQQDIVEANIAPEWRESLRQQRQNSQINLAEWQQALRRHEMLPPLPTDQPNNPKPNALSPEERQQLETLAQQLTQANEQWTGDPTYIPNAGLVILHPFLMRLWNVFGWIEDNQFKTHDLAYRAVYVLEYLTFKNASPQHESQMILNKILCGIPISEVLPRDVELTEKEKEVCESLLQGVIQNWGVLGKTSNEALRNSFLQREGRLSDEGEGFVLRVAQQGIDVLVERLPWGLTMIKIAVMPIMLTVEWV